MGMKLYLEHQIIVEANGGVKNVIQNSLIQIYTIPNLKITHHATNRLE